VASSRPESCFLVTIDDASAANIEKLVSNKYRQKLK